MIPNLRFSQFNDDLNSSNFAETTDKAVKHSITGGPFGSDLKSEHYTESGVRIIQLQNIGDGVFIDKSNIYTSDEKADELNACNIFAGEIILSKMGDPVARACKIPCKDERYLMSSDGIRYVPNEAIIDKEFIFQYINSARFRKQAEAVSTGSTRKRIGLGDLKKIRIRFPSLAEQQKIGRLLLRFDQKINLLTKKKEALETYKKGLMQKIFSQEHRFKREDGTDYPEWSSSTIRELFVSKKGKGLSLSDVKEDGVYKCLLYGSLYTKYNEVISECVEYTDYRETVFGNTNDLLVPASTTTSGADLATFSCLKIDEVMIGGDVTILTPINTQDSRWWAYYLSHYKKYDIAKFAQGSTIVHLYFNHFKKLKVDYPTIEEQKKIAEFLMNMDENISSVQTLINIHSELKNGLLQQMFV